MREPSCRVVAKTSRPTTRPSTPKPTDADNLPPTGLISQIRARSFITIHRVPGITIFGVRQHRIDETLTHYYRHWLEHRERVGLRQLERFFGANWKQQLAAENDKLGVPWDERLDRHTTLKLGVKALTIAFEELVPRLGEPVAVQRRVEFRLAPEIEWTIEGHLDLETRRPMLGAAETVEEIVDYKVKAGSAITDTTAARNPQASLHLAARWLEGRPATRFQFAQTLIPGARRKTLATSLIPTERNVAALRSTLARIALAASQIAALHDRYGPDRPWGFADPTSWKCGPRYCPHWATCPGGAGL